MLAKPLPLECTYQMRKEILLKFKILQKNEIFSHM